MVCLERSSSQTAYHFHQPPPDYIRQLETVLKSDTSIAIINFAIVTVAIVL